MKLNKNKQNIILDVIIIIGLILTLILWIIGYSIASNKKYNQSTTTHINNAGNWNEATSAFTTSKIGPRRTYWLIPKEKNPNGGWDSISGWYEGETPERNKENVEIYNNYKFSPLHNLN